MKKGSMKKAVVALSLLIGMPLLGCATPPDHPERKVSSESRSYASQDKESPRQECREAEIRDEDGVCVRENELARPARRGGR